MVLFGWVVQAFPVVHVIIGQAVGGTLRLLEGKGQQGPQQGQVEGRLPTGDTQVQTQTLLSIGEHSPNQH